nr:UBX domain-containing protein 1-A-like [Leptinotarsa decemlineata]
MSSVVDTLVEMGFSKQKAELALTRTGTNDIQTAMDWLLSHEADLESTETSNPSEPNISEQPVELNNMETSTPEEPTEPAPSANSIKCDDCGKLFKTSEEVEFHAAKTRKLFSENHILIFPHNFVED